MEGSESIRARPQARCAICGEPGERLHAHLADRLFSAPGAWSFRRCPDRGCGLVWLDPMPVPEDLPAAYRTYYTHAAAAPARAFSAGGRRALRALRLTDSILKRLTGLHTERGRLNLLYLHNAPPGALLEVGCGGGGRLAKFRARGWTVTGQEVDPVSAARAAERYGLDVRVGELAALGLPAGGYDAVALNHVLEHVPDPAGLLAECRRLLKPGGRLALATPNPASRGHRQFGAAWMGLDPPRHLHLFPPAALRRLADAAGLIVVRGGSSAARAYSSAAGSLEIARTGRHQMGVQAAPRDHRAALAFQYAAWIGGDGPRGAGEESVLVARAPGGAEGAA